MAADDQEIVSLEDPGELSRLLFLPRILWGALAFSVIVYVAIGVVVAGSGPAVPTAPMLVYVFAGVALATAGAIPLVRRALMPPMSDRSGGIGPTRTAARAATARLVSASIVSYAMSESIAIFGLILTFLSHDRRYIFAFAALSLICFALYFPRADLLRSVLRGAAEGARR